MFHMTPRDEEYPADEDCCVSAISKKIPNECEYPFKDKWDDGDEFNLLFEFQSERLLEVGAESVELEAIP